MVYELCQCMIRRKNDNEMIFHALLNWTGHHVTTENSYLMDTSYYDEKV